MFTLSPSGLLARKKVRSQDYVGYDPTFISRYIMQAAVLETYQQHMGIKRLKVLDVGGSGSIITQFIDVDLTILDILPNRQKLPNYIRGSALEMPLPDNSFDVVISCDVLEHIPKESRKKFLMESARVTRDLLITAAPFDLEGVRAAEISANDFYKKLTGKDHIWLLEHLQDALPDIHEAHHALRSSGMHVGHFSHTSLQNWQLVTRAGFFLEQERLDDKDPDFVEHIRALNSHYLDHLMAYDFSETGYRTFLLASKQHELDIKREKDVFDPLLTPIYQSLTDAILPLL